MLQLISGPLTKAYKYLMYLGVEPGDSRTETNKVILLNKICLFVILLIEIYCVNYLYRGMMMMFHISQLLSIGWFIVFFLTASKKHYAARLFSVALSGLTITLVCYLYSMKSGVYYYLIPAAVGSFCLFSADQKKELALSAVIPLILYIISARYFGDEPRLVEMNNEYLLSLLYHTSFGLSLIATLLFVYYFAIENKAIEKELIKARVKAESADQAKSKFLSMMSHEIRTPITAMIGFTDMLRRQPSKEQRNQYLNNLSVSGNNLLQIVNEILDFSVLESGNLKTVTAPFSLSELAKEVVSGLQPLADKQGIQLELKSDEGLAAYHEADRKLINQILINLVHNAIKFTHEGYVRLILEARESDKEGFQHIDIIIEDTGIGFSVDQKDDIFKRFSQLSGDINRKYGGTGLGLSIVRELVKVTGADIEVASEPGQGTRFTIHYHLKTNHDFVAIANPESLMADFGEKKVLLVEDDVFNAMIASYILKEWNMEVDEAGDGNQAIQKCIRNRYDIILMDVQMPECDGITATFRIRNQEGGLNLATPIIGYTANLSAEERNRGLDAGMNDYLIKPFNRMMLYQSLVRLGLRDANDERNPTN